MRRRAALATAAAAPLLLQGCDAAAVKTFPTLASAQRAIEGLKSGWRSTGTFTLPQMLNHAAQSVEFSMRGFPELKSALFRHTVGSAAFGVFDARGAMRHGLDEPIPGAPALAAADSLDDAIMRLLKALNDFDAFGGKLAPHFAYGELSKPQFLRAHLMHLANHWDEVART